MQSISTIGLDIAKSVFQVHGVDAAGQVVMRRAIDASGLCEALRQAAEERQHRRGGDLRGGHETQHAVRADQDGRATELSDASSSAPSLHPPADCRHQFDPRLSCRVRATSKRLDAIPGVGPALATALVASVADAKAFRSGRDFSARVGLVPKRNSSGGKDKLGDRYLRSLFTTGALAVIRYAKIHGTQHRPWLTALLARRPTKVAAIALANKLARMASAMMARNERCREPVALAA
jgi:transposase